MPHAPCPMAERFAKFHLELHPEKTRLLEFGPYAAEKRRKRYSTGDTFFTADVVWDAAQAKGAFAQRSRVPGVASPYIDMAAFTPEVLSLPVVVLGKHGNYTHAVALRDGMIYDSEKKGARPLTKRNLLDSLDPIYGVYVFHDAHNRPDLSASSAFPRPASSKIGTTKMEPFGVPASPTSAW